MLRLGDWRVYKRPRIVSPNKALFAAFQKVIEEIGIFGLRLLWKMSSYIIF